MRRFRLLNSFLPLEQFLDFLVRGDMPGKKREEFEAEDGFDALEGMSCVPAVSFLVNTEL